ncbi:MAG: YndJ family transporter [Acidimicrobiales bacterium]
MEPILVGLTLIDLAVVAGVALVLPAALGGPGRWWALAAASLAVACVQDRGTAEAAVLTLPWLVVGGAVRVRALREAGPLLFWTRPQAIHLLAHAYGLVAAWWMLLSQAERTMAGITEPFVQLTAVHFTYAGAGALVLASTALDSVATGGPRRLGRAAVVLTAGAPPVVATGFVTGWPLAQVGGALAMALGVFATALLELHRAVGCRLSGPVRALLVVSGLAVWAPMVLAVAWAAGQHWDIAALSIPDMVRTHGAANALGFVGAGLLARRLTRPHQEVTPWS